MNMRKIFGGSLAFSLVGASLLGGVFAWTLSDSERDQVAVGTGAFELVYNQDPDALLGPNGTEVRVGGGGGEATGDFVLKAGNESGKLTIKNVQSDQGLCTVADFSGRIYVLTPDEEMVPGDGEGDWEFEAYITTNEDARVNCMGALVTYEIQVDAETVRLVDREPLFESDQESDPEP